MCVPTLLLRKFRPAAVHPVSLFAAAVGPNWEDTCSHARTNVDRAKRRPRVMCTVAVVSDDIPPATTTEHG